MLVFLVQAPHFENRCWETLGLENPRVGPPNTYMTSDTVQITLHPLYLIQMTTLQVRNDYIYFIDQGTEAQEVN